MGTFVRLIASVTMGVAMASILTVTIASTSWASARPPAHVTVAAERPSQGSLVVVCAGTRMDYGCKTAG
jgi:hypothetical protein